MSPPRGELLGPDTVPRVIHAVFDRNVSLCEGTPPGPLAQLRCDLRQVPLALGREMLSVHGQELNITVPEHSDPFTSNCSLELLERAVCDDEGVPFLGMPPGGYDILLGEAVAPRILWVDPPNTTQGPEAQLPLTVSLVFSERIRLGTAAAGLYARLEPLTSGGGGPAVELPLAAGRVTVVGEDLRLDLGVSVQAHMDYSLVLPTGAVVDWSGNPFGGLARGEYIFRTGRPAAREFAGASLSDSGPSGLAIAGIASSAVAGTAVAAYLALHCMRLNGSSRMSWTRAFSCRSSGSSSRVEPEVSNSASLSLAWVFGDKVTPPQVAAPVLHVNAQAVPRSGQPKSPAPHVRGSPARPPAVTRGW